MREPILHTHHVAGKTYSTCTGSYKDVIEYVHWAAGKPLAVKDAWPMAKRYIPRMSYPNFVSTAAEMARGKGLVRLQHGVYIHKDVLAMMS